MKRSVATLVLAVAMLVAWGGGSASAAVGDLTFAGCLANDSAQGCVDVPNSPVGAADVVISPDGRSVYTSGSDPGAPINGIISTFDRASDGSLTYRGCIGNTASQGCVDVPGAPLRGLFGLAISPNGSSLYAASQISASLTHFTRAADGSLAFGSCLASDATDGCFDVSGGNAPMANALEVAVAPDGSQVYVRANGGGPSIGRLIRFNADSQGVPGFSSCIADSSGEGCLNSGGGRLAGIGGMVVTGGSIYAPGSTFTTINRYSRAPFGIAECMTRAMGIPPCSNIPNEPGLMRAMALSPDETSMYVAGDELGTGYLTEIALGADGAMTYSRCLSDQDAGCVDLPNSPIQGAADVTVSPDGASVYVAGPDSDSIATFRRNAGGTLTYASCLANTVVQGCGVVAGGPLDGAGRVAVSPDGRNAYVASAGSASLSVFNRETPASPSGSLDLDLKTKAKQGVGKLKATATCSAACEIVVQAKGKAGKKFKSKPVTASLGAGEPTKLKLKLKRSLLRKVDDRKGKVTFAATATAGGLTASDTAKAKLKP